MKDFADIIGQPYAGQQKSREEIRQTTSTIPRPKDWRYGKKLTEWEPAKTSLSRDEFIEQCTPLADRILVKLIPWKFEPLVIRPTKEGLISSACRNAVVLKLGTGKRGDGNNRIPFTVRPGHEVLIGNWTDLEIEDIVLCSEKDVRGIVWRT
jgi:co-chaperonin GroES (HSP10)